MRQKNHLTTTAFRLMAGENEEEKNIREPLKSKQSRINSFVRFINNTLRKVDIVWLNYEGIRVVYKTLQPHQYVDVNTFVGHPWICRDANTGDKLLFQLKEVYEPLPWTSNDGWPPKRKIVTITIPVYSLKDRCMQIIRRIIHPNQINNLELPKTLKMDLQTMFS